MHNENVCYKLNFRVSTKMKLVNSTVRNIPPGMSLVFVFSTYLCNPNPNPTQVKMKPKPWHKRWERFELQGMDMSEVLPQERIEEGKTWWKPEYQRLDLLHLYRPSSHSNEDRIKIKAEFDKHVQNLKRVKKSSAS